MPASFSSFVCISEHVYNLQKIFTNISAPLPQDLMQQNDIAYVLNASNTCPKPDFIPESHFLRVPVNDSFCEKILPWLDKSVEFIGQLSGKMPFKRVVSH